MVNVLYVIINTIKKIKHIKYHVNMYITKNVSKNGQKYQKHVPCVEHCYKNVKHVIVLVLFIMIIMEYINRQGRYLVFKTFILIKKVFFIRGNGGGDLNNQYFLSLIHLK